MMLAMDYNCLTSCALAAGGILVGITFSAIFSGLETGIYVLNKVRLALRVADGHMAARQIQNALDRFGAMLASLLLGTNASNYLVTASVVMLLHALDVDEVEYYSTAFVTPFLFIFGEMGPKNFFRQTAEYSVYRCAGILNAAMKLFSVTGIAPVLDLLSRSMMKLLRVRSDMQAADALVPAAVRSYLAEGRAHGALSDDQHNMAHRVVELRGTTVADVMTPRRMVVSAPVDCPREKLITLLAGHDFSRLPLWRGHTANVVGVVNLNRLLFDGDPAATPEKHMQKPVWIDENASVSRSLLELQNARHTIAFVRDRRGGFAGVVTLKDIVEEIIGELQAW